MSTRINKYIAERTKYSRRKAEDLIKEKRVKVNGEVITDLSTLIDNNDKVYLDDILLYSVESKYYLLNKPSGVISSTNDQFNRKTVVDLIEDDSNIYPVGRLDYDTTGLIILTNDGDFANFIMHPKNNIKKTYKAKVQGIVTSDELKNLEEGILIDGFKTSKAKAKLKKVYKKTNTSLVELTINEGKNHQVKRMFEEINHQVLKLDRTHIGFLNKKNLRRGEYRVISKKEISKLYLLGKRGY